MHEAILVFSYPEEKIAAALAEALSPEASVTEVPKTRAHITVQEHDVTVHIHADDLGALRAAVNSYARWVEAGERAAGVGARAR
jgi:tRNA threonylcarbamoyladenosine modification (KEOPS) complex  Pcc1 subunit